MDFQAFADASREAMLLREYDVWMIGANAPQLSTENPTDETLRWLTDQLISYEEQLAAGPQELDKLDDLASRLNYLFDAEYAAQPDPPGLGRSDDVPSVIRWRYDMAVERLATVRTSLHAHLQILQALVSTYTSARAKVEHDLQWQAYIKDKFGVEPGDIEREMKHRAQIDASALSAIDANIGFVMAGAA